MTRCSGLCAVLLAGVLSAGCSNDDERRQLAEEAQRKARAMEEALRSKPEKAENLVRSLTRAVEQLENPVETVSRDELQKMLPAEIAGMTRTNYSASRRGIEGFSYTHVKSEFEDTDTSGWMKLSITDIGNVSGFASLGLDLLNVEIDEENQNGFKRTGLYKGFKSFQKHETRGARSTSELVVFVGERFVARAEAQDVEWTRVEDVFDSIPIDKLPAMITVP